MGGEQSRETAAARSEGAERATEAGVDAELSDVYGRDSPRPSICSDGSDLPYISYTVNRPIGESPKRTVASRGMRTGLKSGLRYGLRVGSNSGSGSGSSGSPRRFRRKGSRPSEVVVVREATTAPTMDPEMVRIQGIPPFLPIMRGALTAPWARDPDVLERLDAPALVALARRYQVHLHSAAQQTASKQDELTERIRETDGRVNNLATLVTERQRLFARHAERLSQVSEVSHLLTQTHATLNQTLELLETLNNMLPREERMDPFVWTTG